MWTHRSWQGRFTPHPLPPRDRLRAYAAHCNAVEGNTTFYATPTPATTHAWAAQTAADFRLVPKVPQLVTHERRLTDVAAPMRAFLDAVAPLGPRAHALWVQLPASFGPGDLAALARFLRRLPAAHRRAVEVRHPGFFADPRAARLLEQVLADADAEWVPFDTTTFFRTPPATAAERETWTRKPRLPRRTRALTAHPIVRYLGRDDPAATVEGWQPWLEVVAGWLAEGRSPTVFVHTPDNVDAPALARRFHEEVRARVPSLAPLPEPPPAAPSTLF
ncbi:DUF72 domain-containing protein [Pilimelia terevasa]|nr:DUF72 domain-containing protein [Pilimelia terevasa]